MFLETIAEQELRRVVEKNKIYRIAFTLAEVLIVLGIIGLIADMTIPTLHQQIDKIVTVTKLQKAYTSIEQAVRLSEIDNGSVLDWNFGDAGQSLENTKRFYDTYFKSYLRTAALCGEGSENSYIGKCGVAVSSQGYNYLLADGVGFSIVSSEQGASIVLDTNGGKSPNKMGRDVFYVEIKSQKGLLPYGYEKGMTREQIINNGFAGCNSSGANNQKHMCTALIMYDGWKIADDYPW